MALKSTILTQFQRPSGMLGGLAGHIMANRQSNIERNKWTVGLLNLKANHIVLEFGCGPGLAMKVCAAKLPKGFVVGIDHSSVMIKQATNRLYPEIRDGRAELICGDLRQMEIHSSQFDRIFSLNVVQFITDKNAMFDAISKKLAPNGMCATTYQPRTGDISRSAALSMAKEVHSAMQETGFQGIKTHELPLQPVPAICVTGRTTR